MTWPEAADLVGCPVSTIDWHTRTGRIEHRERRGNRPSLRRSSIEEFATWWRERENAKARRADQRARARQGCRDRQPIHPPEPEGWLSSREAGALLDVHPTTVARLAQEGRLEGRLHARRWWFTQASVAALRAERHEWLSFVDAAELVGSTPWTVGRAAARGEIRQGVVGRSQPSLERRSVEQWAARQAELREQRQRAEEARERARAEAAGPPDDGEVWLDVKTAALVLGLSGNGVRAMAGTGRVPHERRGGRYWFRRRDVEQLAAARAFRARWSRPIPVL